MAGLDGSTSISLPLAEGPQCLKLHTSNSSHGWVSEPSPGMDQGGGQQVMAEFCTQSMRKCGPDLLNLALGRDGETMIVTRNSEALGM